MGSMSNIIVWDIETVPDLKGFVAANGPKLHPTLYRRSHLPVPHRVGKSHSAVSLFLFSVCHRPTVGGGKAVVWCQSASLASLCSRRGPTWTHSSKSGVH